VTVDIIYNDAFVGGGDPYLSVLSSARRRGRPDERNRQVVVSSHYNDQAYIIYYAACRRGLSRSLSVFLFFWSLPPAFPSRVSYRVIIYALYHGCGKKKKDANFCLKSSHDIVTHVNDSSEPLDYLRCLFIHYTATQHRYCRANEWIFSYHQQ
jgi:hypothetical protein